MTEENINISPEDLLKVMTPRRRNLQPRIAPEAEPATKATPKAAAKPTPPKAD